MSGSLFHLFHNVTADINPQKNTRSKSAYALVYYRLRIVYNIWNLFFFSVLQSNSEISGKTSLRNESLVQAQGFLVHLTKSLIKLLKHNHECSQTEESSIAKYVHKHSLIKTYISMLIFLLAQPSLLLFSYATVIFYVCFYCLFYIHGAKLGPNWASLVYILATAL